MFLSIVRYGLYNSNYKLDNDSADGSKTCTDLEEIKERWKEHFSNLLNQKGTADPEACKNITKRPVRKELCDEITMTELDNALKIQGVGKHQAKMEFQLTFLNMAA